jgi:epoxyqueuosine reductase
MLRKVLQDKLSPYKDYIFGFADLNGLIDKKFPGYRYGISIGKRLDDEIINRISDGPTLEYYDYYKRINRELAELTSVIKKDLESIGIDSHPLEPTVTNAEEKYPAYLKTLTVDLSHKMVATRAGLGWIGKTDLFISKKFGPRLRLVTILLKDKPEALARPVNESRCGNCSVCVEKCPAGAATGLLWNIKVHRDVFFDAWKCRNMCAELAGRRLNVDERICGLCVSVCPLGKKQSLKLNNNE